MAATCPHCDRPLDVTLFASGRPVVCACGEPILLPVSVGRPDPEPAPERGRKKRVRRKEMGRLARAAEDVVDLILSEDVPMVDVAVARSNLRTLAERLFPDRMELFEMVYESRFDRLIEQWRE